MNEDRYLNNTQTFWNYLKKIILIRPSSRVSCQFENLGKYVWLLTSVWANVIFWCLWPVAVTSGGSGPLIIIMMPGVSSDNISWSSVNIVSNKDWWPLEVSNCEIKLKLSSVLRSDYWRGCFCTYVLYPLLYILFSVKTVNEKGSILRKKVFSPFI